MKNIQFTKNFSLQEFLLTSHGSNPEQYDPPIEVINNLLNLSVFVLQPLRDKLQKPIFITSGYRCPAINKLVKGVPNSQHLTGQAADIVLFDGSNIELFNLIRKMRTQNQLQFDQLIDEFNYRWIHVSYNISYNRNQTLHL